MRMNNMGTETRIRAMAREQNRDISEKIALGLAKPTAALDYDTRLFNQSGGLDSGLNEDTSMFDRPLFAAQQAAQSIYRPRAVNLEGPSEDEVYESVTKGSRFEVLGHAQKGFKGAEDATERDGPVQFQKDQDVFRISAFLRINSCCATLVWEINKSSLVCEPSASARVTSMAGSVPSSD